MQPDRQSADLRQPDRQSADLRQPDRQSADLRQPDSHLTLGSQTASDKVSWLVLSKFCIGFGQIQVVDENAVPIWTRPFGSNGESDRKENSLRIGSDRRIRVFRPIRAEPYIRLIISAHLRPTGSFKLILNQMIYFFYLVPAFLYFSKIIHPVYTVVVSTLTSYCKHSLLSLLILAYVGSPLATSWRSA